MSVNNCYWFVQRLWGRREKFEINILENHNYARIFEFADHVRISKYDWERLQKELEGAKVKGPGCIVDNGNETLQMGLIEHSPVY